MTNQVRSFYTNLTPEEEQAYRKVLDFIDTTRRDHPDLSLDFFLNGVVARGDIDTTDRIEDWSGRLADVFKEPRDRPAACQGDGPRPDRIVRVRPMNEIIGLTDI